MKHTDTSVILIAVAFFAVNFFMPSSVNAAGPLPVDLLSTVDFVIVSKTGITNTGSHTSDITGDIGSSPITSAAMDNVFCSEITGTIYGVDVAYTGSGIQTCFQGNPPLANKTLIDNAVLDMGTAYTDAASRINPTATELGAGNIGGMTIAPGLYKWSTGVTIPTDVTLSGDADDVWIFQIAGDLTLASAGNILSGTKILLSGGASASNIFWQVGGLTGATLGTYATFNGTILSAKQVIIQTGALLNGRALADTQVTLDANTLTLVPAPSIVIPTNNNNNSGSSNSAGTRRRTLIASSLGGNSGSSGSSESNSTSSASSTTTTYPGLPRTGFASNGNTNLIYTLILSGSALAIIVLGFTQKKQVVSKK